jgi:hypothetical protein
MHRSGQPLRPCAHGVRGRGQTASALVARGRAACSEVSGSRGCPFWLRPARAGCRPGVLRDARSGPSGRAIRFGERVAMTGVAALRRQVVRARSGRWLLPGDLPLVDRLEEAAGDAAWARSAFPKRGGCSPSRGAFGSSAAGFGHRRRRQLPHEVVTAVQAACSSRCRLMGPESCELSGLRPWWRAGSGRRKLNRPRPSGRGALAG